MCLRLTQHVAFKSECERETKTNGAAIERERIRERPFDKRHIARMHGYYRAMPYPSAGNAELSGALRLVFSGLQIHTNRPGYN